MKITMRIYRLHDLDLMYLYKMPRFSIQKIIQSSLRQYIKDRKSPIRQSTVKFNVPKTTFAFNPTKSSVLFHIHLDEKKDAEVVEWINQIPQGFRNAMIKNITRNYLDFPMTIPYELNGNFEEMKTVNKENKKKNNGQNKEKPKSNTETQSVADIVLNTEPEDKTKINKNPPQTTQNTDKTKVNNNNQNDESQNDDVFDDFESLMNGF